MKRTQMKIWRRPAAEKTDPAEWQYVMDRDRACIASLIDEAHVCEGRDTADHVPGHNDNAMGKRALCPVHRTSDRHVLVRLCWGANVNGWASANRDRERDWLANMEPL